MSISSALGNAVSGLTASSRLAETVADNLANAMTEGFARREATLSSLVNGGYGNGVGIAGISRVTNPAVTAIRRSAGADSAAANDISSAWSRLVQAFGGIGEEGSLADAASRFENALRSAASSPQSTAMLAEVSAAGGDYATMINRISSQTSAVRMEADASIARQVRQVNDALHQIESINAEIRMISLQGGNANALIDQRQLLVDRVNTIIPIRQSARDDGGIALYSRDGAVLLDGKAAEIGFDPTPVITPDMQIGGALSGLTLNDRPVAATNGGLLAGGTLETGFTIRDTITVSLQSSIDGLAADLITRFQDSGADPTVLPGDTGLFTDDGMAFTTGNKTGLAGRIGLNPLASAETGELWRLRDGLHAAMPGDAGDATLLNAMLDTFTQTAPPPAGNAVTTPVSGASFARELSALIHLQSANSETSAAGIAARHDALRTAELAESSVDSDAELQQLLEIEKIYAANARVISTVDGLMKTLLEM